MLSPTASTSGGVAAAHATRPRTRAAAMTTNGTTRRDSLTGGVRGFSTPRDGLLSRRPPHFVDNPVAVERPFA
jgi:hypothetical protein